MRFEGVVLGGRFQRDFDAIFRFRNRWIYIGDDRRFDTFQA